MKPDTTERPDKMKKNLDSRLKRIEGQVRGIQRMLEEDKYCDDVLIQISAIQSALTSVSHLILEHHLKHCVVDKIKDDDEEIIDEFLKTIERALKN